MAIEEKANWRLRDFAGTVVALIVQGVVWRATLEMTQADPTLMPNLGLYLLLATIAMAVALLVRRRPAVKIAIGGCALQVLLVILGISA
ncbi:MAG: hypothetical protein SW019_12715 [Actinomycetota bacterium]|nr:hypothetical protein [Actinomycetota bacterium]